MIIYNTEDFLKLKKNIRTEEAETNEYAKQILDFIENNQVLREMKSDIEPEEDCIVNKRIEPERNPTQGTCEDTNTEYELNIKRLKEFVDVLGHELNKVKELLNKQDYK